MSPILTFFLMIAGSFLIGGAFGYLAQLAGFSGIEGFTITRGGPSSCGGCAFVVFGIIFSISSAIVRSSGAPMNGVAGRVLLLTLLSFAVMFWGFLHGLVFNPWKWLGQHEETEVIISGAGNRDRKNRDHPEETSTTKDVSDAKKHNIEVEWPDLDDLDQ